VLGLKQREIVGIERKANVIISLRPTDQIERSGQFVRRENSIRVCTHVFWDIRGAELNGCPRDLSTVSLAPRFDTYQSHHIVCPNYRYRKFILSDES